jgi:cGMP-dependent protein kinase
MDDYLTERKYLRNSYETKFYISSLLIIIDYLHKKNIAHRDLKPSNIMIDKTGYLKMIDFGTSKCVTDFMQTIIGTPHYIAPEILVGKGYSLSSDFWSLGICMYEIYYGCYPFGNNATDILEVYKEVLHK